MMATTSCNNLFDDAPINQISEETTWTNSMLLDEYVNTWYHGMNNGFDNYVFTMSGFGSMSRYFMPWFGDQITVGRSDWLNSGYGDILKANETTITAWAQNSWSNYYTQIQYINSFFANESRISDQAQRTRIEGEAHFFLGLLSLSALAAFRWFAYHRPCHRPVSESREDTACLLSADG